MPNCFLYNFCNHKDCDKDFCPRKFKLETLFRYTLIPETQWTKQILNVDADGTDLTEFKQLAEIEKNIEKFVESGNNLYLWSYISGNGKTSWSIRLAQAYLHKIWPTAQLGCKVLFIRVPKFLSDIKSNLNSRNEDAQYVLENVLQADLVIWDDIGTKPGTSFEINKLLEILDHRLAYKKANIFTANLGQLELKAALDTRLVSRIYDTSTVIELHGSGKRPCKREEY